MFFTPTPNTNTVQMRDVLVKSFARRSKLRRSTPFIEVSSGLSSMRIALLLLVVLALLSTVLFLATLEDRPASPPPEDATAVPRVNSLNAGIQFELPAPNLGTPGLAATPTG